MKERKVEVLLSDVNYEIRRQMYRLEYQKVLGRHHLWRTCASALHKAEHDLEIMDEVKRHKLDKNKWSFFANLFSNYYSISRISRHSIMT